MGESSGSRYISVKGWEVEGERVRYRQGECCEAGVFLGGKCFW